MAQQAYGLLQNPHVLALNGEYYAGLIAEALLARQKAAKKEPKPETPATVVTTKPAATKPKPPGDQSAVSTAASVTRVLPDQGRTPPKPTGAMSAQKAQDYLMRRDAARQR